MVVVVVGPHIAAGGGRHLHAPEAPRRASAVAENSACESENEALPVAAAEEDAENEEDGAARASWRRGLRR